MKILRRLFLGIFISFVAVFVLGTVSYLGVKKVDIKFNELVELPIPSILRLSNMTESFILSIEEAHSYRLYGNAESKEEYFSNMKEFNRLMTELKKELHYGTSEIPAEDTVLINDISGKVSTLNKLVVDDFAQYEQTREPGNTSFDPFSEKKTEIVVLLHNYMEMEKEEIVTAKAEVNALSVQIGIEMIFVVLTVLVVIILINGLIAKSIVSPIRSLEEAAKKVGKGDLDVRVKVSGKDELSILSAAFNSMADNVGQSHLKLETQVIARTAELQEKLVELEKMNELMTGREVKMIELKKEVEALKNQLGKA